MPGVERLLPLIFNIASKGLFRGRIVLPTQGIEPEEDLDEALKRSAKKLDEEKPEDEWRVLKLSDAIACVSEAIEGGIARDAVLGALKVFVLGDGKTFSPKLDIGKIIGQNIIDRMRKKILEQKEKRVYIRVSKPGSRGRPKKGEEPPEDSYGARRRGAAGTRK